jgi:hypothetical protein
MLDTRTVENCPYRSNVQQTPSGEWAVCKLMQRQTELADDLCRVRPDACRACCDGGWDVLDAWNPVLTPLIYEAASAVIRRQGMAGCDIEQAQRLMNQATAQLELLPRDPALAVIPARLNQPCRHLGDPVVDGSDGYGEPSYADGFGEPSCADGQSFQCHHPDHGRTTLLQCRRCRDWTGSPGVRGLTLSELLPAPAVRNQRRVNNWAVGVTTAPRRQPTLQWCLDSLHRAGWQKPHLFSDGMAELPDEAKDCPRTIRGRPIGAWPNYYLALAELVLHHPQADAYLLLQDDVYLYDHENLREYLDGVLWPGARPSLVSLYSTEVNSAVDCGWHSDRYPWVCGALAFVFPAEIARSFLADHRVLNHRRHSSQGREGIDTVIGSWTAARGQAIWYPMPSLVQHLGNSSAIQNGALNGGPRRARWFAGDVEVPFQAGSTLDDFAESEFPPPAARQPEYEERVRVGESRMKKRRAVICGLCRDARAWLPRTIARIERLGGMFDDYRVVLFENDSRDQTLELLQGWEQRNPRVQILTQRLGRPRHQQVRCLDRASRMAEYRNRYRDHIVQEFADFDFAIVVDTDLRGGWSYQGVANTFGQDDWDFVGSYGLLHGPRTRHIGSPCHFDAWAFRHQGHSEPHDNVAINNLTFQRGDSMLQVWSCFGGLGVYRMPCLLQARYEGGDCEHVRLHQSLRNAGFQRLFINPSQITVY